MRGHEDIGGGEQGAVCRRGIAEPHVRAVGPHLAGLEGLGQVRFRDHLAPGGVDDHDAVLHLGEGVLVEHAPGLVGERGVDGDDVRLGQHLVQGLQFGHGVGGEEGIVGDHLHAEALGALGHFRGDGAGADQAQGLLEQLGALELVLGELAFLHGHVRLDQAGRDGHHEGHGHLGHGHAGGGGGVHHLHAPGFAGRLVHVVQADAAADDQLEVGGLVDHLLGDLGLGADEQDLGLGQFGHVGIGQHGAELLEPLGQGRVEGVSDQDLHVSSP